MSSGTGLPPREHAAFAVISRLLSCIVTEQLLPSFYISMPQSKKVSGVLVIASHSLPEKKVQGPSYSGDIFAIVPLFQAPVCQKHNGRWGRSVGLVDPLEMHPMIFTLIPGSQPVIERDALATELSRTLRESSWTFPGHTLCQTSDPLVYWGVLADILQVAEPTRGVIGQELYSSLHHQYLSYKNPTKCPSLCSPSIEWEQSLVAGHPTHPMHRARLHTSADSSYDWYHPKIRFVKVSRHLLDLRGPFQSMSRLLVSKAFQGEAQHLNQDTFVYMPVHELQVPNIVKMFEGVEVMPVEVGLVARAQTSIRTVVMDELPGFALKIGVDVKISSSLRTISHFTTDFGPRFSAEVIPKLEIDRSVLTVETEPASAIYLTGDPDLRKHFTAVFRQEYKCKADENVIIVAALLETDHANIRPGTPAVIEAFNLDTQKKRITFLDRYIELSCKAFFPPLIYNGVAFEAHAQNVLVKVDTNGKTITGFVIRDLGGLRIHPSTLCKSTGLDFKFLPNHCIATETVQEIYPKFYHTYVHNHIQRLIRLLGLHHNGVGWELLRRHMNTAIPADHELRELWLSPQSSTVESKCLMRMRLQDSYRENIYCPLPNMIQYKPDYLDHRRESLL